MSAHRQHYLEANAPIRRKLFTEQRVNPGEVIAVILLIVVACGTTGTWLAKRYAADEPVITPVRSPVVQVYELPSIDVEDARIEGFRAGYASALEQGCSASLTPPLAAR